MSTLIPKMQQDPKLKTRIRNRKFYPIVFGLLLGFRHKRMLVYVKNAPDMVKEEIVVFLSLSCFLGYLFEIDGPLDQRLRDRA